MDKHTVMTLRDLAAFVGRDLSEVHEMFRLTPEKLGLDPSSPTPLIDQASTLMGEF